MDAAIPAVTPALLAHARPHPGAAPEVLLVLAADLGDAPALRAELFSRMQEIEEELLMDAIGLPELATTAEELAATWESDPHHERDCALAVDGAGRCLGAATIALPLRENLESADVRVMTLPELGTDLARLTADALWNRIDRIAAARGRTVLYGYEEHADHPRANFTAAALGDREAGTGDCAHVSGDAAGDLGSGSGEVSPPSRPLLTLAPDHGALFADDPVVRRFAERGFRLVQIERFSVLPVRDVPVRAVPAGLRAESWVGDVPDRLLPAVAHLFTVFEDTIPTGEAEFDAVVHTPERVRDEDRLRRARGMTAYGTVLLADADDAPLGLTFFEVCTGREFGFQEHTVTVPAARGRGYAALLKELNAGHLRAQAPEVERIYTWNAAENAPMLAINNRVGFRPLGMTGLWQRGGSAAD